MAGTYVFGTAPVGPGVEWREHHLRIEQVPVASGSTINKGDLILMTTNGAVQATQSACAAAPGKLGVALMASSSSGTGWVPVPGIPAGYIRAAFGGFLGVNKVNNDSYFIGQPLGASTSAGLVTSATEGSGAMPYLVGHSMEATVSGDKSVGIQLIE